MPGTINAPPTTSNRVFITASQGQQQNPILGPQRGPAVIGWVSQETD